VKRESFSRSRRCTLLPVTPENQESPANALSQALTTSVHDAYLASLLTQAESSFRALRAPSTRRAYEHDWKMFRVWCEEQGRTPALAKGIRE
jgi:hypothetical protein